MYKLAYKPDAIDQLNRLRTFDKRRIVEQIQFLKADPLPDGDDKKKLRPDSDLPPDAPSHELRVGEFRVFYDLDEEEEVVTITHVRKKGRKQTRDLL